MHSRREQSRIPVKLSVSMRHEGREWKTFTKDISTGGLLVEWRDEYPLTAGAIVQVQIENVASSPLVAAKVVRANPAGIALNFVDETPRPSPNAPHDVPAALSADGG